MLPALCTGIPALKAFSMLYIVFPNFYHPASAPTKLRTSQKVYDIGQTCHKYCALLHLEKCSSNITLKNVMRNCYLCKEVATYMYLVGISLLGHYKLDNSFPSTARMPLTSPPIFFIIVVIFYYNKL